MLLHNIGGRAARKIEIERLQKGPYHIEFDPVSALAKGERIPIHHMTHKDDTFYHASNSFHAFPTEGFKQFLEHDAGFDEVQLDLRITYIDTDDSEHSTIQRIHYDPVPADVRVSTE